MTKNTLTDEGWPRPKNSAGYPVPWISPIEMLTQMNPRRMSRIVKSKLCQVCGLGHPKGSRVFMAVAFQPDQEQVPSQAHCAVQVMDIAILHERCARLAVAACPKLSDTNENGLLKVYSTPIEKVFTLNHLQHALFAHLSDLRYETSFRPKGHPDR